MKKIEPNHIEKQKSERFWDIRSVNYDKLFWTKDTGYLDVIFEEGNFKSNDLVLDVGVGTGMVARKIKPLVKHVIGVDISDSMFMNGEWEGISIIKWDICNALFTRDIFDKVIARMVFHHILENVDIAILRCYDLLKSNGKMIVAEGLPPSDDPYVIEWYKKMFKLKEERLTFTEKELVNRLSKIGFKNIRVREYIMKDFSVRNWLVNSGITKEKQDAILHLHFSADKRIRNAYNMRCTNDDCLINTRNVILTGEK